MEIIYKAFDGTCFSMEEACREYERKAEFKMWDIHGCPTDSTFDCMVVYFPDPQGSRAFINLAREAEAITDGIDYDDHGWFIWDDYNGEFHYVDDETINALRKILPEKSRR